MASWLKHTNPNYRGDQLRTVSSHLNGEVLDNLPDHLIRKDQGESDEAYASRRKIASYVPHYTRAVLALAGMINQNENDDSFERTWWDSEQLGTPEEQGTPMFDLWRNADGSGTDWEVVKTQALIDQIGYQVEWTLIEGVQRDGGTLADARDNGSIKLINPIAVQDWVTDNTGRITEVKMKHVVDDRSSVTATDDPQERWMVYDLEGFQEFRKPRKDEDGEAVPTMGKQPYGPDGFQYEGRDGRPILPIYRTKVPVRAPVGFMMARLAEWIFNLRNVRNFHLWTSALARAFIEAFDDNGRFDKDIYEFVGDLFEEGASYFPTEIGYSSPSMEGAETRNKTLKSETENFYSVFFHSFGDVARERTATEINQQVAQSVGAYLALQTQSLDEWENDALWRLAQVNAPDAGPEVWGQASVDRSTDFSHVDVTEQIRTLVENAFGDNPIPLGPTGRANATQKIADHFDIETVEEEISSEIQTGGGERGSLLQRIRQQNGQNAGVEL